MNFLPSFLSTTQQVLIKNYLAYDGMSIYRRNYVTDHLFVDFVLSGSHFLCILARF